MALPLVGINGRCYDLTAGHEPMTPSEFIETAPLYTWMKIINFEPPDSITRMCSSDLCKRETTWFSVCKTHETIVTTPKISFHHVGYTCALCKNKSYAVFYELFWTKNEKTAGWQYSAVRKIGQTPAQDISIPAELSDRLGSTADYYKKALICRSQGYGIAAMAYLRRVVDEKTDALIDVIAELAKTYVTDANGIRNLLSAKQEVRYEDKLKVAAELIPEAIKPGGVNPLGQLYQLTSTGLHSQTDDQCIAIFDDLKADFEYVFRNLHLQAEERRDFAKRMQSRAGKALGT